MYCLNTKHRQQTTSNPITPTAGNAVVQAVVRVLKGFHGTRALT